MKRIVYSVFISVLSLAIASMALWAQAGKNITVKGSDTMVILGQKWAEVYMRKNPGTTIQVTGGGSGVGIAALINGTTDIAESSRPMRDKEKEDARTRRGKPVMEMPVALDGLAVYVHASNPLNEISIPQLKKIYQGVIKNWKEVGGRGEKILLYGRENNSGTYAYFKEHVLDNGDFFPTVQTLPGTAAVINAVAKDTRGIGYGGIAYGKSIKHLRVKKDESSPAVEPTLENVQSNVYPISRNLFWYTAGEPQGEIKRFVDWVLSADGQAVVKDVGYYPLPPRSKAAGTTVPSQKVKRSR